jgi:hypothetical protein
MKKEIVKEELRWLLDAINEQFETVWKYDKEIPQLEFDILFDNVHKMYENMALLKRLNREEAMPEASAGSKPGRAEAPKANVVEEGRSDRGDEATIVPGESDMPRVTIRFEKPDTPSQEMPFIPVVKETKKSSASKKPVQANTLDLFAAEEPAFSIKLKEAREKTFGPKIPSERINNLKSAITINDKFMFINELFEGNLREYNETIETLNGFSTLVEAGEFMELLVRKNFWDTGSRAFQKLRELVERRF